MVVTEFKINMNIYFYDVDTKLIQALKQEIDIKLHENSLGSQRDQYPSGSPDSIDINDAYKEIKEELKEVP